MIGKQVGFLVMLITSFMSFQVMSQSEGQTRYISDDLFTYIHAGPGLNYRILGSVTAGTKVTLLKTDSETNFSQIVDDKNRTGWIDTDFIKKNRSVRELVPGLQQEVSQTQKVLEQEQQTNQRLNQQIQSLSNSVKALEKQLASSEKKQSQLTRELENHDKTEQMEWFTRGGILAVVSLLIGIIITYLPKKRRRNDNWM
jgi:SH3 domain protein